MDFLNEVFFSSKQGKINKQWLNEISPSFIEDYFKNILPGHSPFQWDYNFLKTLICPILYRKTKPLWVISFSFLPGIKFMYRKRENLLKNKSDNISKKYRIK